MKKQNPKMNIISIFSYAPESLPEEYRQYAVASGYGNPHIAGDDVTQAFNLLAQSREGDWVYLSQSNIMTGDLTLRRDADKPILRLPTGVGTFTASASDESKSDSPMASAASASDA